MLRSFLNQDLDSDKNHWHWGRGHFEDSVTNICARVAEIDKQRYLVWDKQEEPTLFDVLARFCERQSCKQVDRVYGLLGLLPSSGLRPNYDYEQEPAKAFVEATEEVIRQSQNLDVPLPEPLGAAGCVQVFNRLSYRGPAVLGHRFQL